MMTSSISSSDLPTRLRPKLFKTVFGQPKAVKQMTRWTKAGQVPHAVLLTGPSGTGKTTCLRILASKMGCGSHDLKELNCADVRGIDTIRGIKKLMNLHATAGKGKPRIWILDEVAKLTNDAQTSLLKMLEEPPAHVYFFLATTDPQKLLSTIHTRCRHVALKLLSDDDMEALLESACKAESLKISMDVIEKIVQEAAGSARKALVFLEQVAHLDSDKEQIEAINTEEKKEQAIQIARNLLNYKIRWSDMAKVLRGVDEDPEQLRWMVLGYCSSILTSERQPVPRVAHRLDLIVEAFRDNWYDCKRAGLIAACRMVCGNKDQ